MSRDTTEIANELLAENAALKGKLAQRDAQIAEHDEQIASLQGKLDLAVAGLRSKAARCEKAEAQIAALAAENVALMPDEPSSIEAPSHLDEYEAACWIAGACWLRAEMLRRIAAIDTTPQQYESLAGWKMVPIEPTEEMVAAWRKDMNHSYAREFSEKIGEDEVVFAYQAMLEASPVITTNSKVITYKQKEDE